MGEIVLEASRNPRSGVITLTVDPGTGAQLEYRRFRAILGGLSWPSGSSPGYYAILGEPATGEGKTRFEGIEVPRGKLHVLIERVVDSALLIKLSEKLGDDCARFGCTSVYCELVIGEDGRYDQRAHLMRQLLGDASQVSIMRAPFTEDAKSTRGEVLQLNLSVVEHWIREDRVELPENSLARAQIKAVTRQDLADEQAEPRLFAARALGFAVSAFDRLGAVQGVFVPKRTHRMPKGTARPR